MVGTLSKQTSKRSNKMWHLVVRSIDLKTRITKGDVLKKDERK